MDFFWDLPPVTRTYIALSVVTSSLCALDIVTPFHLYYNHHAIMVGGQVWRLATNFLFFGSSLGLDLIFALYFLVRYARGLEEGYGRGRSSDFLFLMVCGCAMLMAAAPWMNLYFFGSPLTFMLVYLWSRRNAGMQIALLGLVHFTAPYLPWALLGFSLLLGHDVTSDALGIAVGHIYFFLEDVWPPLATARGWRVTHVLPSPSNLRALWRRCRAPRGAVAAAPAAAPLFDNRVH